MPRSKDGLTAKERRFIDEYFLCGLNQSQAAINAGYRRRQSGAENMSKPVIRAEIDRRSKLIQMSADEAIARLSLQARGDMREFIGLTMSDMKVHPDATNIKKLKRSVTRDKDGNATETVEIELYDAQAAQVHITKILGAYKTTVEIDWKREIQDAGLNPDELEQELVREFERHLISGQKRIDSVSPDEGQSTG